MTSSSLPPIPEVADINAADLVNRVIPATGKRFVVLLGIINVFPSENLKTYTQQPSGNREVRWDIKIVH